MSGTVVAWLVGAALAGALMLLMLFLLKLRTLHRVEREWLDKIRPGLEAEQEVKAVQTAHWLSTRVAAHDDWLRNLAAIGSSIGILGSIAFAWYQFQTTFRTNVEQISAGRLGIVAERLRSGIGGLGDGDESVRVGNLLL